jgi:adenylate cyclase
VAAHFRLEVNQQSKLLYSGELTGPVELGRQKELLAPKSSLETPFFPRVISPEEKKDDAKDGLPPTEAWSRVPIALRDENRISRRHVLVEPLGGDRVRVKNISTNNTLQLRTGNEVPPGESVELAAPCLFTVWNRTVRVEVESALDLQSLAEPTLAPGFEPGSDPFGAPVAFTSLRRQDAESLIRWLQTVTRVLQSAAGSSDFFPRAAQGIVDLVDLDSGAVLLYKNGQWQEVAVHVRSTESQVEHNWRWSQRVLQWVRSERKTHWQLPESSGQDGGSTAGVQAVVAAPILDRHGEVIGALYGDRRVGVGVRAKSPISTYEAMLVETLACGVAAGLARVEQEQNAAAARVQFEQFFTKELSLQLTAQPDLLQGRDEEVTLLFCDIRGFSSISEAMGPARTVEWIGDVMNTLSECVSDYQGVLVDYIGDELMAMWGAPIKQPNHAELACRAAMAMLDRLPEMQQKWKARLEKEFALGIGINSGIARVGNTGSIRKFKYGPLGNTVNLASRVQGATKYLKSPLLITSATHQLLNGIFPARRVCTVCVVNIAEPVDLYELGAADDERWTTICQGYEKALTQFEAGEFLPAAQELGKVLAVHPDDGPSLILLSRACNWAVNPEQDKQFQREWVLPGK